MEIEKGRFFARHCHVIAGGRTADLSDTQPTSLSPAAVRPMAYDATEYPLLSSLLFDLDIWTTEKEGWREGGRTIRRAFMQSHLRETAASGNYDVRMRATRRMITRVVTLGRRKHGRTTLLTVEVSYSKLHRNSLKIEENL